MRYCLAMLLLIIGTGCRSAMEVTEEERSKLDPKLLMLFTEERSPDSRLLTTKAPDGTILYSVIVRSESPDDIRALGVMVGSVMGDVITVRVSKDELRKLVSLKSVRQIEASVHDSLH